MTVRINKRESGFDWASGSGSRNSKGPLTKNEKRKIMFSLESLKLFSELWSPFAL
jgi:hypothetical protein